MSGGIRDGEVDDVARAAALNGQQTVALRNLAGSSAIAGMPLEVDELRVSAEVIAGRLDFDEARRRLGV